MSRFLTIFANSGFCKILYKGHRLFHWTTFHIMHKKQKNQTLSTHLYIYNGTYSHKKVVHTSKFYLLRKSSLQMKLLPYVIIYSIKGVSESSRWINVKANIIYNRVTW